MSILNSFAAEVGSGVSANTIFYVKAYPKGGVSLKYFKIIVSLLIVFAYGYSLIKNDFSYAPISSLSLSFLLIIIGVEEIQRKSNWGYLFFVVSALVIVVSIFSF